jgi:hypothetical protein
MTIKPRTESGSGMTGYRTSNVGLCGKPTIIRIDVCEGSTGRAGEEVGFGSVGRGTMIFDGRVAGMDRVGIGIIAPDDGAGTGGTGVTVLNRSIEST